MKRKTKSRCWQNRYRKISKNLTAEEFDAISWDVIKYFDDYMESVHHSISNLGALYTKTAKVTGDTYQKGIFKMNWKGIKYIFVYKQEWEEFPNKFGK